jgi:hypothetical protein
MIARWRVAAAAVLMSIGSFAHAAEGYDFPIDTVLWYRYALIQDVGWTSIGDHLEFTQTLRWTFALRATGTADGVATVAATIVRVEARSSGPGAEHVIDSRNEDAASDATFGPLAALAGSTLTLSVVQSSGDVSAVSGGEQLRTRLAERMPAAMPGQPSPFAGEIDRLYSDAALARWWSALLVLPGNEAPLPLAEGLDAHLTRTWDANRFTLALPEGSSPTLTLVGDPTPVTGTMHDLTGSGEVALNKGIPGAITGELTYQLDLTALTQPVTQTHRLRWALETLTKAE